MQPERVMAIVLALGLAAGCTSVDDWSGLKRGKETTTVERIDDGQVIAGLTIPRPPTTTVPTIPTISARPWTRSSRSLRSSAATVLIGRPPRSGAVRPGLARGGP